MKCFDTPILLLIFNRPEKTEKLIREISRIKPKYLFISADGPRTNIRNENERCLKSRDMLKLIDWDCTVRTNFSDRNLGCKKGVTNGIDWFFSFVNQGIILEDDCVPNISFFNYCNSLLSKYSKNECVMHIGGTNLQNGIIRGNASYYFSKLAHVWGWATWKRAWALYDAELKDFDPEDSFEMLTKIFNDKKLADYYIKNLNKVKEGLIDTWDYQWNYCIWKNNGVSVIPQLNLISNTGFNKDATHTTTENSYLGNKLTFDFEIEKHPDNFSFNLEADLYTFNKVRGTAINRIFKKVKTLLK